MKSSIGIASVLSVIVLSGCASGGGVQKLETTDTRACAQNFTYDGSFLAGRTFKTKDIVKGVNPKTAIKRAAKYTAEDGWNIANIDKEMGIISASQNVSFGDGKTAPLTISVDSSSGGSEVRMSYSISGGVTAPVDAVKDHFCATIEAIQG
ncbi:MAG: hypothetical protein CMF25_04630 [Kangiellaceae bacterium]|nr:hypothetical protein [Kangiellaceae bacterium]